MSWTKEKFDETVKQVTAKASQDEQFRTLCASDIRDAIRQVSGEEVPASIRIGVLDPSANHVNIILPPAKKAVDELSESELESVAGGGKAEAESFFNDVGDFATNMAIGATPYGALIIIEEITGDKITR